MSDGEKTNDLVFSRDSEELPCPADIEPADPACRKAHFLGPEDEVLAGDPDVDKKELRPLKPAADLMDKDIKPGQDNDEYRRLGREFRHGVDP
jgi:hypothetical protein